MPIGSAEGSNVSLNTLFNKIADEGGLEKGDSELRYSDQKGFHIHSGFKFSGVGKDAAVKREVKKAEASALLRVSIDNDTGLKGAGSALFSKFGIEHHKVTVSELKLLHQEALKITSAANGGNKQAYVENFFGKNSTVMKNNFQANSEPIQANSEPVYAEVVVTGQKAQSTILEGRQERSGLPKKYIEPIYQNTGDVGAENLSFAVGTRNDADNVTYSSIRVDDNHITEANSGDIYATVRRDRSSVEVSDLGSQAPEQAPPLTSRPERGEDNDDFEERESWLRYKR